MSKNPFFYLSGCVKENLMLGGSRAMDKHPIQGGVEILLVTYNYKLYTNFTYPVMYSHVKRFLNSENDLPSLFLWAKKWLYCNGEVVALSSGQMVDDS